MEDNQRNRKQKRYAAEPLQGQQSVKDTHSENLQQIEPRQIHFKASQINVCNLSSNLMFKIILGLFALVLIYMFVINGKFDQIQEANQNLINDKFNQIKESNQKIVTQLNQKMGLLAQKDSSITSMKQIYRQKQKSFQQQIKQQDQYKVKQQQSASDKLSLEKELRKTISQHETKEKELQKQVEQQQAKVKELQQLRTAAPKTSKEGPRATPPARDLSVEDKELLPKYCLRTPLVKNPLPKEGEKEMLMQTRYGFSMYGDAREKSVSLFINKDGYWQPQNIHLMGRFLRPGYNVMNLGSQTGLEALVIANIIGPSGNLIIFEPYSFSNTLVTKSFHLNKWMDRTIIYNRAASDVKGVANLSIAKQNTGSASLVDRTKYSSIIISTDVEVEQVKIDLVDNVIPSDIQLDFALIDVEMHEVEALLGMRQVIDRSPNLVMIVEWTYGTNVLRNPEKTKEIIQFLLDRNYKFYQVKGFDPWICRVGTYTEYKDPLNELLNIKFEDILVIPSHVTLPK